MLLTIPCVCPWGTAVNANSSWEKFSDVQTVAPTSAKGQENIAQEHGKNNKHLGISIVILSSLLILTPLT